MAEQRDPGKLSVHFVLPAVGPNRLGGMEKLAAEILSALNPQRFESSLVCFCASNAALELVADGVVNQYVVAKRPGVDWTQIGRLWRHFRAARPDIVHTFNEGALLYAYPAAKLAGVPCVVHAEHGRLELGERRLLQLARIGMARACDAVIVVSDALEEAVVREGVAASKVHRPRNGVDLKRFQVAGSKAVSRREWGLAAETPLVGTVGSLTPQKNHELLIEAAARLEAITVVIAGAGEREEALTALIAEKGLTARVRLVGPVSRIPEFMAALDVFALPSLTEGTSLALLEAMAAGLPAVATDVGGNAAAIRDGETGYLTPSGDVAEFAAKLAKLTADKALRASMGTAARQRAEQHFSFSKTIEEYESLFERVARESRAARRRP